MDYTFDFHSVLSNTDVLIDGLLVTLELTIAANLVGLVLGFGVALLTTSSIFPVRMLSMLFVEFFRCTPAIVQIIWFFYCVPILFDVYIDSITMGIVALGLNLTAFNAEAYRASIQSVAREQMDASMALGFNPVQRTLYIILPNALRLSMPVLVTNGIGTFQQSALVALVAVQDLMYAGKSLATQTYRPIETFTTVALVYFVISFVVAQCVEYAARRYEPTSR